MKDKRDIYCEYSFWEAFFEKETQIMQERSKRRLWDAFYEFLSNNNLFFNIPNKSVCDQTPGGKNLNELFNKKGGAGIKFIPNSFPKIDSVSDKNDNLLNSVFLTMDSTSVCKRRSENFGIIVFNLDLVLSADHVFVDNGISFSKDNGQNWTFLQRIKRKCPSICYCNSLVVVDRYLLSDKNTNTFNRNLRPIFDAILPQQLKKGIIFTISIIAENITMSIEVKRLLLVNLIKDLRPLLSFSLNIFDSNDLLHDRSILTNNIILTSGLGFDVIGNNGKARKPTDISLQFPFLNNTITDSHSYISCIFNVLKVERQRRSYNNNFWGEKPPRSHLLDFYYGNGQKNANLNSGRKNANFNNNDAFSILFQNACSKHRHKAKY